MAITTTRDRTLKGFENELVEGATVTVDGSEWTVGRRVWTSYTTCGGQHTVEHAMVRAGGAEIAIGCVPTQAQQIAARRETEAKAEAAEHRTQAARRAAADATYAAAYAADSYLAECDEEHGRRPGYSLKRSY